MKEWTTSLSGLEGKGGGKADKAGKYKRSELTDKDDQALEQGCELSCFRHSEAAPLSWNNGNIHGELPLSL